MVGGVGTVPPLRTCSGRSWKPPFGSSRRRHLIGSSYPAAPVPEVRRLMIGRSRYHVYWEVDVGSFTVTIVAVWYAGRGSGPQL